MNLFKNKVFIISGIVIFSLLIIIFTLGMFKDSSMRVWAMNDLISFILVFSAINLFFIAFINIGKPTKEFYLFKTIWLQEMIVILGVFGAVLGLLFMFSAIVNNPNLDAASRLGGSLAVSIITIVYALLGAFSFFLLEKYIELNKNTSISPNIQSPQEGFKYTSIVNLLVFMGIIIFCYFLVSMIPDVNITILFYNDLIFIVVLILILILFYKGDSFFNLLKSLFWYNTDSEKNIRYNIIYIQNMKKIFGVCFSITLVIVPILLWGGMTVSPDSSATTVEKYGSNVLPFVSIRNTLYYSHWSCIFIVLLSLMEGSQANKLYLQIGETITFDRYYALKFLLAPIFLLYLYIGFSTILAFVVI